MTMPGAERDICWDEFTFLVDQLIEQIGGRQFDLYMLVSRGGLIPGGLLAKRSPFYNITVLSIQWYDGKTKMDKPIVLQTPHESLLHGKDVLIIDEVWQSGDTLAFATKLVTRAGGRAHTAVIHFKPNQSTNTGQPTFHSEIEERWIRYPWEKSEGQT
ncbi:phosphoribosyltransferase [Patescibacteria group bacterium]|nr:phosphoribosyltransferase [Patescibacteria group bacterium]MBU1890496.1 phosphoribosyltransferase [Patescibacteria group bacterium]